MIKIRIKMFIFLNPHLEITILLALDYAIATSKAKS